MAKGDVSPGVSAKLDERMMAAKPADLSERQWCLQGKVSTSFFTDLRNGREPGIDKVERMAAVLGLSLSDLLDDRPAIPTEAELAQALRDMLPGMPRGALDTRVRYLAESVGRALKLPTDRRASDQGRRSRGGVVGAPVREATS